jgi:hypothetical protein
MAEKSYCVSLLFPLFHECMAKFRHEGEEKEPTMR